MRWSWLTLMLLATPAVAQQQPVVAQKVIAVLQQQRNAAMDAAARAEALAASLADEVANLRSQLAEKDRTEKEKAKEPEK